MRRPTRRLPLVGSLLVSALGLGGLIGLAYWGMNLPSTGRLATTATTGLIQVWPRRLPVAGAEGYFVLLFEDGTSILEGPQGRSQPLVSPEEASRPATESLADKIARRLAEQKVKRKEGLGQLIVLTKGVVDIPPDSIVTYRGDDYLVVFQPSGNSVAYHADGRVEARERTTPRPPIKQRDASKEEQP